jgi:cytolysin (calcineurin-like family phosphatase)
LSVKAQAPAFLDDHDGEGRTFWYSRDSWTSLIMFVAGYNYSVIEADFQGSGFMP